MHDGPAARGPGLLGGQTEHGPALGLPVVSTMFLYSRNPRAPAQSAYLDGDREALRDAYRRGWIDTLHSVGDFAEETPCTRDLAARGFDALAADDIRIAVWTNHGGPENRQNVLKAGGVGDIPGSPCYLADLAEAYGIRHWWLSELTPVIGQDRPSAAAEYYEAHGLAGWKGLAARAGFARRLGVEPWRGNALLERRTLRDGRTVPAFRRFGRWRHDTVSRPSTARWSSTCTSDRRATRPPTHSGRA